MSNTMKLVGAAGGAVAMLAAIALPFGAMADAGTSVTAIVGKTIDCSGGTAAVGTITPGQAKSADATVSVTTNAVGGFKVTYSTPGNLTSSGNTIAYNTSAAAGTQGWKAVVTGTSHTSEWSSTSIANGVTWTHSSYSASAVTDKITVTVGTSTTTASGDYSGTLSATCVAN